MLSMKNIRELVENKFSGNDESTLIDRVVYKAGAEDALQEFKNYCEEQGFWNGKLDEFLIDMHD